MPSERRAQYLAAKDRRRGAPPRKVRWNIDLAEFELQCPTCRAASKPSFWPITVEFWLPKRPSRCRGCWLEYDRQKRRATRQDPEIRAREALAVAAWRERNPGYNIETARLWREQNRERKRASDRARYAAHRLLPLLADAPAFAGAPGGSD